MSAKLSDGTLSESSFSDSDVSFHDPHAVGIDYYSGSGDSDIDTEPLGGKRDNRDEENEVPRRGHGKGGFKNLKNRKRRKWVMRSVESQGTTSGGSNTGLKVALAIGILLVIAAIAYGVYYFMKNKTSLLGSGSGSTSSTSSLVTSMGTTVQAAAAAATVATSPPQEQQSGSSALQEQPSGNAFSVTGAGAVGGSSGAPLNTAGGNGSCAALHNGSHGAHNSTGRGTRTGSRSASLTGARTGTALGITIDSNATATSLQKRASTVSDGAQVKGSTAVTGASGVTTGSPTVGDNSGHTESGGQSGSLTGKGDHCGNIESGGLDGGGISLTGSVSAPGGSSEPTGATSNLIVATGSVNSRRRRAIVTYLHIPPLK